MVCAQVTSAPLEPGARFLVMVQDPERAAMSAWSSWVSVAMSASREVIWDAAVMEVVGEATEMEGSAAAG